MKFTNWREKRKFARASFGWPAALLNNGQGATIHGWVRDISSGGALVHIKTKLKVNDQVELAINIPDFKDISSAKGIIVRVDILDEETSTPTYALGISFIKMSSKGLEFFSGNIPSGWKRSVLDTNDRQEIPDKLNHTEKNPERINRLKQWVAGGIAVLVLAAIAFSQLGSQGSSLTEKGLLFSSESGSIDLQLVHKVSQQQTNTIIQIENRLAEIENDTILSDQIKEIYSRLNSQIKELQQIKKTLQNTSEIKKAAPAEIVFNKETTIKKFPSYHVVRPGETIFSISQQHGLEIDKLMHDNALHKGTIIFTNQKLLISSNASNTQKE